MAVRRWDGTSWVAVNERSEAFGGVRRPIIRVWRDGVFGPSWYLVSTIRRWTGTGWVAAYTVTFPDPAPDPDPDPDSGGGGGGGVPDSGGGGSLGQQIAFLQRTTTSLNQQVAASRQRTWGNGSINSSISSISSSSSIFISRIRTTLQTGASRYRSSVPTSRHVDALDVAAGNARRLADQYRGRAGLATTVSALDLAVLAAAGAVVAERGRINTRQGRRARLRTVYNQKRIVRFTTGGVALTEPFLPAS